MSKKDNVGDWYNGYLDTTYNIHRAIIMRHSLRAHDSSLIQPLCHVISSSSIAPCPIHQPFPLFSMSVVLLFHFYTRFFFPFADTITFIILSGSSHAIPLSSFHHSVPLSSHWSIALFPCPPISYRSIIKRSCIMTLAVNSLSFCCPEPF